MNEWMNIILFFIMVLIYQIFYLFFSKILGDYDELGIIKKIKINNLKIIFYQKS
jgi:hypothetical protein